MGVVYLASSPADDVVALKLVRPELAGDKDFRRRFNLEVATARRVGGVCTAKVQDADLDADCPWVVTDFVAGPNLADLVDRHGPLPPDQQRALALGLAEALVAIHRAGIVHRDLKPTNVLCSPSGPKVIDFGIAQAADVTKLTLTGEVVGSPAWMSPEQVAGGAATSGGDVFSLGSVLVFAATGRPPFGKGPLQGVMWRILNESPDLGVEGSLDVELRPLVVRMLKKDAAERPTAQALLDHLSTPGLDGASTVAQVLHRSWVLPAGEAGPTAAPRGGRGRVEAAASEEAATPASDPQDHRLSGRAAGWYIDPHGNGGLRWWDGMGWTGDVADAPSADSGSLPPRRADRVGDQRRRLFRGSWILAASIVTMLLLGVVIWSIVPGAIGQKHAPSTSVLSQSGGAKWSPPVLVDNNTRHLNSVSCPSRTFCVAVDLEGLAYTYDGTTWRGPTRFGPGSLDSSNVTCATPSFCVATASDLDGGYTVVSDRGRWGDRPSLGKNPSVSCPSSSFCLAADEAGTEAFTFAGVGWTPIPAPPGGAETLSCPTTSFCVGFDGTGDVSVWKAGSWNRGQRVGSSSFATFVTCASATFCVADGPREGQVITYDGNRWSKPRELDPGAGFDGLSCPLPTFCAAVDNSGNVFFFNGQTWSRPTHLFDPLVGFGTISCSAPTFCTLVTMAGDAFKFST
jgi:hypothetical protein